MPSHGEFLQFMSIQLRGGHESGDGRPEQCFDCDASELGPGRAPVGLCSKTPRDRGKGAKMCKKNIKQ